jgi:ubiquinone/menaquinone biosynthesis C-methylase UbiE
MKDTSVNAQLLENYSTYYDDLDSTWRKIGAVEKASNIIDLCSPFPHDSILEVGAGDGSVLAQLSGRDFCKKMFALEISPSGVHAIVEKKIPSLVNVELFDGYNIPYSDKEFDLVALTHVVEHVEHPRKLLYEAGRVGKFVFIEVPLEDNWRLPLDYTFDKVGHINFYSPRTIRRLVQTCGFTVLDQRITNRSKNGYVYQDKAKGNIKYWLKEILLKLSPQIAVSAFTYHLSLVCKKT